MPGLKRGPGKDKILNVVLYGSLVIQTFHKQNPGLPCCYEKREREIKINTEIKKKRKKEKKEKREGKKGNLINNL